MTEDSEQGSLLGSTNGQCNMSMPVGSNVLVSPIDPESLLRVCKCGPSPCLSAGGGLNLPS